ncbi:MAG: aminoacyl-tRNA hydrolase [Kiritimatiellia bacterium]
MNLVVGLGNPGRQYANTPHNAGFRVVDELARRLGETLRESGRFEAQVAKVDMEGRRTVLAQPLTFMNNSGAAVGAILRCNGIASSDMIVVLDDADLDAGVLRIRKTGGSGGHRGLKSILETVGTDAFVRVRVGIGRDPGHENLVSQVLRPLSGEARDVFEKAVVRAADAVACILRDGPDAAMNKFNADVESGRGKPRQV